MPNAARQLPLDTAEALLPSTDPVWSGEVHGPVAALHRAIEERMLTGAEPMVVLPLTPRPAEAFVQSVSRAAGWCAVGACATAVLFLLL